MTVQRGAQLRAEGWGWRHSSRGEWALNDISFTIEPGERVLLLGPSGAGKSTLLHALAGVLGGDEDGEQSGSLLVDEGRPSDRRSRIGMVLQDPDAQVILARVGDDVAFGMENFEVPRAQIWPRVTAALDAVGLRLPLDHDTGALSGGQKQRLALAGVIAMDPGVIFLDEPTANLDPEGVVEVRDAIAATAGRTGATLVVIEHRTEVWLPVVDRVIVLDHSGRIVADGDPAVILGNERDRLIDAGVWVPGAPLPALDRAPRPEEEALVVAEGVGVGRSRTDAVQDGLDFSVRPGRILAVTGPNGAGKSTLALTLGGLIPPTSGQLEAASDFAPSAVRRRPHAWRSKELLTRIGSVFQEPEHQFLTGTVRDELALGPRTLGRDPAEIGAVTEELLERLRLTELAGANPYTLSGGEKRRLSVATVLATGPRLIVLDEPTFGQDRRTWEQLVRLLAEVADDGTAIVAITHDLDFIEVLADDLLELPAWEPAAARPRLEARR